MRVQALVRGLAFLVLVLVLARVLLVRTLGRDGIRIDVVSNVRNSRGKRGSRRRSRSTTTTLSIQTDFHTTTITTILMITQKTPNQISPFVIPIKNCEISSSEPRSKKVMNEKTTEHW
jgi:hypothetical protein